MPGASGSGGSETQNFCYDEQNRLVWAGNSCSQPGAGNGTCGSGTLSNSLTGAGYSASYIYTHLGQMWQAPQSTSSTNSQYLYCDSSHPHQLTGLYQSGSTCSNKQGQTYASSYDAWGNVTSRTVTGTTATLSYDGLDHLTKYDAGSSGQEQYLYDASGKRVLRRSTSSGTTSMTVYAFGLEEHRYSGSGANQGNTYYYMLGSLLVGEFDGTNTNMFLTDTLGSVIETISATANTAAVQGNQVYSPYGSPRYQQGQMGTTKGFTGQYNDSLTGLDYYNARYYDPVVGRFLSADTVKGNMQGVDPYAYAGNNPETFNDPTGHDQGDPYLDYVVSWYTSTHTTQRTFSPVAGVIPHGEVPRGEVRSLWPRYYSTGHPNYPGYGQPDIMNLSIGLIWEVKTGGGTGPGMGSQWPDPFTEAYGTDQVKWYAARANATRQSLPPGLRRFWQMGTTRNDIGLRDALAGCPANICIVGFGDGAILAITSNVDGVISYMLLQQRTSSRVRTVIIELSPQVYLDMLVRLDETLRLQSAYENRLVTTGDDVPPYQPPTPPECADCVTDPGSGLPLNTPVPVGVGACSFTPDTLVGTPQGKEAIGQILVGEQILAYNLLTHMIEVEPVLHVWIHPDQDLIDITVLTMLPSHTFKTRVRMEELIHTTDEHPFLTQETGFVAAGQLRIGIHVLGRDGSVGLITRINPIPGMMVMYNLEVAQDHTFLVGDGQWIVHNACRPRL